AVDDQRRYFHRRQSRRHIETAARAKNLTDGFAGEPWITIDEGIEQILAKLGIGKLRRDQSAQVLDVILVDAYFRVTVDAFIDRTSRAAAAADENDRFEDLGMVEPE